MKKLLIIGLVCAIFFDWYDPEFRFTVITWNIEKFGGSKDRTHLVLIAKTIERADIVAIQEVVTNEMGEEKIEELVRILNFKDKIWDFAVSDTTNSPPNVKEKYAFLWKTSKVKALNNSRLLREMDTDIDREPYYITFTNGKKAFNIISLHTRPVDFENGKRTKEEIESLARIPQLVANSPSLILGDFNMNEQDSSFCGLKTYGYKACLINQQTSLKKTCVERDYKSESLDNIFYSKGILNHNAQVKDYVHNCKYYDFIKRISNHLPVEATFSLE